MSGTQAVRSLGRKTDEYDARSVAIAATYNRGLRRVQLDNVTVVLGLLVERRWQLVSQRQRAICQLHALLTDMVPAGAKTHLTSKKAAAVLRTVPVDDVVTLERKLLARELLDDIRRLDRRASLQRAGGSPKRWPPTARR